MMKYIKILFNFFSSKTKKNTCEKCKRIVCARDTFHMQRLLSDELCLFMNLEPNSKKSRVEVTRFLCNYIEQNKLNTKDNKRIFKVDENLAKLYKIDVDSEISYYEQQYLIQQHFDN